MPPESTTEKEPWAAMDLADRSAMYLARATAVASSVWNLRILGAIFVSHRQTRISGKPSKIVEETG